MVSDTSSASLLISSAATSSSIDPLSLGQAAVDLEFNQFQPQSPYKGGGSGIDFLRIERFVIFDREHELVQGLVEIAASIEESLALLIREIVRRQYPFADRDGGRSRSGDGLPDFADAAKFLLELHTAHCSRAIE